MKSLRRQVSVGMCDPRDGHLRAIPFYETRARRTGSSLKDPLNQWLLKKTVKCAVKKDIKTLAVIGPSGCAGGMSAYTANPQSPVLLRRY